MTATRQDWNTYTFKGRPCWVAAEVGAALGYAGNGHEFVANLGRKWNADIVRGDDCLTLSYIDLQSFLDKNAGARERYAQAPRLVIVFETGLRLAIARSRKPEARRLLRTIMETRQKEEKNVQTTAAMTLFNHAFENRKITTIIYKGRPCWLAMDVGKAIGYEGDANGFVDQIRREWSDEMIDGHDLVYLSGEELQEFRNVAEVPGDLPGSRAPHLVVLFESGLWLALAKTRKAAGKRLRRFLVEHVLPQVARDGRYLPEREVTPQGVMVESDHARRMRELDVQERELDIRIRQIKATALVTLVDSLPYLSDDIRQAYRVKATEEITGQNLAGLLPPAAESLSWESPTQIGKRLGVSANAVGKAVTALGLRGADGKSREIVNKAKGHDRTVTSWLYSPAAVAEIEAHLRR